MIPYYDEQGITIYHGDCREILPHLSGEALITDPPFGIGWARGSWNDAPEAYADLMRWLVSEAARAVPIGWCFVFQAMPNVSRFHEWFPAGWRLFAACKNFAQIRPTAIWHSWDPVVFWRNGPHTGPHTGHINRDYFVGNVSGVFREQSIHPCPKPLDTMRHLAQLAAPVGGRILDPFMGSGTTLVAAKETGRMATGIEIEERYCVLAVTRLRQTVLPSPMLIEPETLALFP